MQAELRPQERYQALSGPVDQRKCGKVRVDRDSGLHLRDCSNARVLPVFLNAPKDELHGPFCAECCAGEAADSATNDCNPCHSNLQPNHERGPERLRDGIAFIEKAKNIGSSYESADVRERGGQFAVIATAPAFGYAAAPGGAGGFSVVG